MDTGQQADMRWGWGEGSFAKGRTTGLQGAWLCPGYPLLFCLPSPMSGWSSCLRMVLLALEPLLTPCSASHTPS